MSKRFRYALSIIGLVLACTLAFANSVSAQNAENSKKEKEQQEKEQKEKKGFLGRAKDKITGNKDADDDKVELEYRKLLESAQRKYNDPKKDDFKRLVDRLYKDKRREHSEAAFQMNTFNSKDELTTFTGDKLRLEDTLYDNHVVQDYVNRVGHSLLPPDSLHRYAFKVVLNPIPDARALSTGTIYVTTGLLSLIDTEAQMAYILGHEIAHVEKNHWLDDAMVIVEMEEKTRNMEKWAGLGALIGGVIGGVATRSLSSGVGIGILSGAGTYFLLKFVANSKTFDWDRAQENQADEEGIRMMFERNYDPREVPKFYARLRALADKEPRLGDGFLARTERVTERLGFLPEVLSKRSAKQNMVRGSSNLRRLRASEATESLAISPLEAGKSITLDAENEKREIEAGKRLASFDALLREKLERNEIIGTTFEFESVMADLKRDNGIRSFYYDMFAVSLENLREARQIRSNDPYAHYYYGKVLQLTARNRAEKAEALQSFITAIDNDKRGVLAEPWLHRALAFLGDRNPNQNQEIVGYLHKYVEVYQHEHAGALPPNMDVIYAYLKDLGDHEWVSHPVMNVSPKNSNSGVNPVSAERIVERPVERAAPQPEQPPAPKPASETPKRKPVRP
jgi:hypothetical protein